MPPQIPLENKTIMPKQKQRHRHVYVFVFGILTLLVVLYFTGKAPSNFPTESTVTIHSGDNLQTFAEELKDGGYIRSKVLFLNMITLVYRERNIAPGDYYFNQPVSTYRLAWRIAFGDHGVSPIRVTIPEGKNIFEIGEILSNKLDTITTDEFVAFAQEKEGYLFPDTFFFYPSATLSDVVDTMNNLFDSKTKKLLSDMSSDEKKRIITMASLIEKEAKGDDDRSIISGILFKRLEIGMALQVDATVDYAKTRQVLDGVPYKESLYNTYTHKDLPPGPIANPGILAIEAAINPSESSYLYYLHDKRGSIHYARTFAEHKANIAKYLR